jgi:hypothetical protein
VIIIPKSEADQPAPSIGLLDRVERHLRARCAPATALHISGPRWIKVTVRAGIVPIMSVAADSLVDDVRELVTRYLHPLTGGDLRDGWPFGQSPQRSHLYRLIGAHAHVSHIKTLTIITEPPLPDGTETLTIDQKRALEGALIFSGQHEITLAGPAAEDS